jgi:hypothetical protein
MTRRSGIWRRSAAAIAAVALLFFSIIAPCRAADLDPAQMSADEIKVLQQRLTDAGCYTGSIDGSASVALVAAIKACPDQRPSLRIETGMHTEGIFRIGVDAACGLLATGSDDKTVRLWSLPDGKLQRVVRFPIGEGNAGKVYATALSPDGRLLAAGGWDAGAERIGDKIGNISLLIVDLLTGAIRRFRGFESIINHIAFSRDGRRVAVGLEGKNGVRVLDTVSGAELLTDRDRGDGVHRLTFAPDGALITSSYDGQLRRYGSDLKLTAKRAAPDGRFSLGVAIDPSGRRLAVSSADTPSVSILDAKTLARLAKAQTGDVDNGNLGAVSWSGDGSTIVAGSQALEDFANGERRPLLRRFDSAGRRQGADIAASNTIQDIQPCGQGVVFATGEPSFGLLSAQGSAAVLQGPRTTDMRGKRGSAFAVSRDAAIVRFGLGQGDKSSVVFDLAAASLTDSPTLALNLAPPLVDGLPVMDWHNSPAPRFRGARILLVNSEISRSFAIRPGTSDFVLGTEFGVRAYDARVYHHWSRDTPGIAWGVDFSADGETVVVAVGDGTIRWLRWSDGQELLALFVEPQTRKWVAWTPSGYYMASPGGEDLIGWHINRGWNQEADFFAASQFRADYSRPDIVRLVLRTRDEAEAIRQANSASNHSVEVKPVAAAVPPVVAFISPEGGSHFSKDTIEISYSLRSPSDLPIDRLEVLADGQPILASGFEKTNAPEAQGKVVATLPGKDTKVSLIAHSGDLTSAPVTVSLKYDGPTPSTSATDLLKPKLYALLVGVTAYTNPDYDTIHFAAHDAESFAKALEAQKGGLYADVQTKVVDVPIRQNVVDGLYWLQHAATSRDLAIVFLSGHGFRDAKQNFWFLTREADTARLRATAISNDDLVDLIASVPGKKVLFIDACHAGAAMAVGLKAAPAETNPDMNKVVNDFTTAGSGLVVFAASTGTEVAKEDEKWMHGAFTEALIEAIGEGKASTGPGAPITTDLLDHYVVERVKDLTAGVQHPVMNRPVLIPDFPLALAKP